MRTPFALACMSMAAHSYAFDWGMVKHSLLTSSLGNDYESHPIYQFHGSNRATIRENHQELFAKEVKPLTTAQRHQAINAHHNVQSRRARLGLPQTGYASPLVEQEYGELNSLSGFMLNVLQGMSYKGTGNNKCYDASESIIIAIDTSTDLIKKFFIPAIWAEILIQLQDMTALSAAFYVDCNVNKFFNQLVHLSSEEGMSEISGRVAGAYFFEISAA